MSNPLKDYFFHNDGRLIDKWHHYFDIYHHHFGRFRDKKITLVEFGVFHGGSLQMWKDYFGKDARIIGVDIDPRCKSLVEEQVEIYIGDQEDRNFLRELREQVGPIDILIEDGGHQMKQQIATFEEMFPAIVDGGVFLIEDLHTSYWPRVYGGGYKRPGTFIEYVKDLIDQIHHWHFPSDVKFEKNKCAANITGMHIYDSVVVFDKGEKLKPESSRTGSPSFKDIINPEISPRKKKKLKRFFAKFLPGKHKH